jgi:hypothetical protein
MTGSDPHDKARALAVPRWPGAAARRGGGSRWPSLRPAHLLRYVANDHTQDVILAGQDLSWLYHPYDGGADVITASAQQRDILRSATPNGCQSIRPASEPAPTQTPHSMARTG